MWKLLPWQSVVRRAARAYGILDPATFLARVRQFAQPSEVQEPMELLRAGIVFHARGLVNTKAIQHNLDWVWPYWVEKQFNPRDPSFIPRAFSFSHINLTHRNWTAVGLPELPLYPIVDPRGLVTPLHDGWSLDFWLLSDEGSLLLPSKEESAEQSLLLDGRHTLVTKLANPSGTLKQEVEVRLVDGAPELHIHLQAQAKPPNAWLAAAIRPYNPEGVQFIDSLRSDIDHRRWTVNGKTDVLFDRPADALRTAHYEEGDVYHSILEDQKRSEVDCRVGLATAASLYRLQPGQSSELHLTIPLQEDLKSLCKHHHVHPRPWVEVERQAARLRIPDRRMQHIYDAAVHTLYMLSAEDVYPGVYTYRRFWFRDACLMLNAVLGLGLSTRCRRILEAFPERQHRNGYFCSQEGEWDSNGQVLWILSRFCQVTGEKLSTDLLDAASKAVDWLDKKRLPSSTSKGYPGLLPAGFSAEHLGTNDYYYWDDFWAVGGLQSIAHVFRQVGQEDRASKAAALGQAFLESIETSLKAKGTQRRDPGIPAAPGRRMDAGAVGSLVADYPLQIYPPGEARILQTIDFLMANSFEKGGFFQEMIHSGINAYLTLDIAQSLLRAEDPRFAELIRAVADLASETGQWPEAIHPRTLGGCMGDGQHGWAAAEWILMMRSCFIREEENSLIFCSGILPEWLDGETTLSFGPTLTPWGPLSITITPQEDSLEVTWQARWYSTPPAAEVRLPGGQPYPVVHFDRPLTISYPPDSPARRAAPRPATDALVTSR